MIAVCAHVCVLMCSCAHVLICVCANVQDEIAFNGNCSFHCHGATLTMQVAVPCDMIMPFNQTARSHNPETTMLLFTADNISKLI